MLLNLFLLFAVVPVAELYVLIKVGSAVGAMNTVGVVVLTAALGAYLARREGMRTLVRIRQNLAEGTMPGNELIDALLIFVAGLVLITPGFITDTAGFLLLLPHTRAPARKWLKRKFTDWLSRGSVQVRT